jgi:type II secretory pathway component PulF
VALLDPSQGQAYRYRAVTREGRTVSDIVHARDESSAVRRLAADGFVVTRLTRIEAVQAGAGGVDRGLRGGERVLIMRQLALMLEAGVTLLEALETVTVGIVARRGRAQLLAVIAALKQGEPFGRSLRQHAPGFPFYVYAMADVGEASGRVAEVLRAAAEQMAYEDRLRREFVNALTYPAFLACAGIAAVGFIFVEIVPRFSVMIGANAGHMPAMSQAVLGIGNYVNSHLVGVGVVLAALVGLVLFTVNNVAARAWFYQAGHHVPIVGGLLKAREIATWARLTSFALANGVALLTAAVLSRQAAPPGAFRSGLEAFEAELKAGVAVDVALGRNTGLTAMDLSLLRAGEKSGALAPMFGFLADSYDDQLKDAMKRMTALIEPLAIGGISIVVGVVALSLVMALASVYDTVY